KGLEGRFCFDPRRARRNAHRHKAWPAAGTAAVARLHQYHRERHGHGAACLPERKILAFAVDGAALGGRGDAGSREGLSPAQGPQAVAALEGRARQAKGANNFSEPASCPNDKGCVDSKPATPASGFSTSSGTSPRLRHTFRDETRRLRCCPETQDTSKLVT